MLKLLCCILLESYALFTDVSLSAPQWKCCNNSLNTSLAAGSIVELAGIKSYVSGSPHSHRAIILASDIFGYEVTTLRAIADKVAAAGFYVVVPDFFYGDPCDPKDRERSMDEWNESHPTSQGVEDTKAVINALRNHGIRAIGVAGFCWGGKVAALLASTDRIQAVVLLHPVNVTVADIKEVEEPIAILGAEFDTICPQKLVKQLEEVLSAKPEVESYVKIFSGVRHGWTTQYDFEDEKAVKASEEAVQDMLGWFIKYIK